MEWKLTMLTTLGTTHVEWRATRESAEETRTRYEAKGLTFVSLIEAERVLDY